MRRHFSQNTFIGNLTLPMLDDIPPTSSTCPVPEP